MESTDIIVSYPYHDNGSLPNLLLCDVIANRVTPEQLSIAKSHWAREFSPYLKRGPVVGLLMGGDVGLQRRVFSADIAATLVHRLNRATAQLAGSVLITTSPRTSPESKKSLWAGVEVPGYLYDPLTSDGDNPYFGILSYADFLVVTADSVSMCCEAMSSGKPVYIFYDEAIVEQAHMEIAFHLVEKGYARFLYADTTLENFEYQPRNSAQLIADKVWSLLQSKKETLETEPA